VVGWAASVEFFACSYLSKQFLNPVKFSSPPLFPAG
jgi:hypothetical protein